MCISFMDTGNLAGSDFKCYSSPTISHDSGCRGGQELGVMMVPSHAEVVAVQLVMKKFLTIGTLLNLKGELFTPWYSCTISVVWLPNRQPS